MPEGNGASSPASARPSPEPGFALLQIVRIGICLVPATPLLVTWEILFPFVVGKAVFARSIIEITFAFWAALVLFHPRRRPSRSWVIGAFAVWLLVSWVAGVFGVSPTRSMWSTYERMQGVFDLAHWFLFTLMAGSVFRTAADWRLLFSVNLVCGAAVCAAGLLHRYGLMDLGLPSDPHGRMGSTLGSPLFLGAYVTINALIGTALFVQTLGQPAGTIFRRFRNTVGAGLCATLVLVHLWAIWLSGTRSALVGLGAALLMLVAYPVRDRKTAGRAVSAGAAVILSAAVLLTVAATTRVLDPIIGSSPMWNRINAANDGQYPSLDMRTRFAATGLRAFRDRPVLGWGPSNFLVAWGRHHAGDTDVYGDHAHNKPLEELTSAGIPGLVSYLAVWVLALSAVFRSFARRSGWDQVHLYVVGTVLVAFFIQSLFQVDNHVSMMQFSLIIAFAVSVETSESNRESSRGVPARVVVWAALAAALTIAALAHNVRLYRAASAAAEAMAAPRAWPDRLDDFSRSIGGFPLLANQPRRFLFSAAAAELGGLSADDFRRTVELVTREAWRGSRAEPQNWLHEAALATFYQVAATRDARYLPAARRHVDRARELAPGIPQIAAVAELQGRIEAGILASTGVVREAAENGNPAGALPRADAETSSPPR